MSDGQISLTYGSDEPAMPQVVLAWLVIAVALPSLASEGWRLIYFFVIWLSQGKPSFVSIYSNELSLAKSLTSAAASVIAVIVARCSFRRMKFVPMLVACVLLLGAALFDLTTDVMQIWFRKFPIDFYFGVLVRGLGIVAPPAIALGLLIRYRYLFARSTFSLPSPAT